MPVYVSRRDAAEDAGHRLGQQHPGGRADQHQQRRGAGQPAPAARRPLHRQGALHASASGEGGPGGFGSAILTR